MKFIAGKAVFLLTLVCGISGTTMDTLSPSETQDLIRAWNLEHAFGKAFKENKYDGFILHALTKNDIDSEFKEASPLHRQALFTRIQNLKKSQMHGKDAAADLLKTEDLPTKRRKLKQFDDYIGLNVKKDKAIISLGKNGDIKLYRHTDGSLKIAAKSIDLVTQTLTQNGAKISGSGGSAALTAQVAKIQKTVDALGLDGKNFVYSGALAQSMMEGICTSFMGGASGWAFAIKRDCGGKHKAVTCDKLCSSMKESQAGQLKCLNAIHVYGNDPHDNAAQVGLKTHIYNSCGSTSCGPNYCCCVNAGASTTYTSQFMKQAIKVANTDLQKTVDALGLPKGNFLYDGAIAQSMVEGICTSLMGGSGGWAFAIKKDCGGKHKKMTCDQICGGMKESQAGKLKCVNAIHVYGNDPHDDAAEVGLKTYIYNSCGSTSCGPNYCCCTQAGADLTFTTQGMRTQVAKVKKSVDALGIPDGNFVYDGAIAQAMMEGICTSFMGGASGWAFAVKRDCGGKHKAVTCDKLCASMKEGQAGQLKCLNAIHVYGNDPHDEAAKVGLKTHIYNSCGGTSCGPNYCCCVNKGANVDSVIQKVNTQLTKQMNAVIAKQITPMKKTVDALGFPNGDFQFHGGLAQAMMEAICTSMSPGGWSFAIRRDCGGKHKSTPCSSLCANMKESQAGKLACIGAIHVYGNDPHDDPAEVGLKTYNYKSCGGTSCGPNYCCCKQK